MNAQLEALGQERLQHRKLLSWGSEVWGLCGDVKPHRQDVVRTS